MDSSYICSGSSASYRQDSAIYRDSYPSSKYNCYIYRDSLATYMEDSAIYRDNSTDYIDDSGTLKDDPTSYRINLPHRNNFPSNMEEPEMMWFYLDVVKMVLSLIIIF